MKRFFLFMCCFYNQWEIIISFEFVFVLSKRLNGFVMGLFVWLKVGVSLLNGYYLEVVEMGKLCLFLLFD